jgi:phosphoesterase RecJ-like protein
MNVHKVKKYLEAHRSFLITSHIEPDGDAIGSSLAMSIFLEKLGKKAVILAPDPVPKRYQFLPRWREILYTEEQYKEEPDAAIVVDVGDIKRIGWIQGVLERKELPILNIDHHVSNKKYGDINYVDSTASSTSECLFDLFYKLEVIPDKDISDCIAVGIITDTGRFSFKNTTKKTFRICSALAEYGSDFYELSNYIYSNRSVHSIRLLSSVLSTVKVKDGIAFIQLTKKMLKESGAKEEESEGFVNYILNIGDIKAAVFFREKDGGKIRVSLRSKRDSIDVSEIASEFNGGGHSQAAGFRSKETVAKLEGDLLQSFRERYGHGKP